MWSPGPSDLAAATFRAELFVDHGVVLWNLSWFGGHPTLGYSVLAPALMAVLGPRLVAVLAAVAAAALFADATRDRGDGARLSSVWFALGAGAWCWTGRVPFLLGTAIALGAVALALRGRPAWAAVAAVGSTLASPVTGAFLALGAAGWWLTGGGPLERRAGTPALLVAAAVLPAALLALAFPERGTHPFGLLDALPPIGAALAVAVLAPPRFNALRAGAVLYALLCLVDAAIPNALGGNVTRLGALAGGPLVVLALWDQRRTLALALAAPLLWFQLYPAVRDTVIAVGDPSDAAVYHEPLRAALAREGALRTEVVPTETHWESARIAPDHWIARGWLRQLDRDRNPLFHDGELTGPRLIAWLRDNAIDTIALADAPVDGAGREEAELLRAGRVPGLRELARPSGDWRLWRVEGARPLVEGARLLSKDAEAIEISRPDALVRVRWTAKLGAAAAGCTEQAGPWTRVTPNSEGRTVLSAGLLNPSC